MRKRFHKSDAVLYIYTTVDYPLSNTPVFTRNCVPVHASPNVTWQDIVAEIHSLKKLNKTVPIEIGQVLRTCMVDHPDFVVGLTLEGATRVIKGFIEMAQRKGNCPAQEYAWFEQVETLAKEMVATRDFTAYDALNPGHSKRHSDFWPE